MSTIASPRSSSVQGRRITSLVTPTSSTRPSFETGRNSPSANQSGTASPSSISAPVNPRRNRAALREYYNLKKDEQGKAAAGDDAGSEFSLNIQEASEVRESELDREGFVAEGYARDVLEKQSLGELLRTYNGVLTDIRALDAEKKALVYDNYSKLIAATETIRKMRANMDPLNPMASTLDPAIAQIYERAGKLKEELKESLSEEQKVLGRMSSEEREAKKRKERSREVARRILDTPRIMRELVKEGRVQEAKKMWEDPRRVLERWREKGVGGEDVSVCIQDGDAALKGE